MIFNTKLLSIIALMNHVKTKIGVLTLIVSYVAVYPAARRFKKDCELRSRMTGKVVSPTANNILIALVVKVQSRVQAGSQNG